MFSFIVVTNRVGDKEQVRTDKIQRIQDSFLEGSWSGREKATRSIIHFDNNVCLRVVEDRQTLNDLIRKAMETIQSVKEDLI